jgi:hypothetical protein
LEQLNKSMGEMYPMKQDDQAISSKLSSKDHGEFRFENPSFPMNVVTVDPIV